MTTTALLTLEGVSWQAPDGNLLFSQIHENFDARHTGLVGRNGVGKSVLARILSGELQPSAGRCLRNGSVGHLAQQVSPLPRQTVAGLAGVGPLLEALQRIEQGSTSQADFDTVGDRWQLCEELRQQLQLAGLAADINPQTLAAELSGGQRMRVALAGAFLSPVDLLILDEPSNHLDRDSRHQLRQQLQRWPGGLLVISHDRELLGQMQRIVELSPQGLRSYGGDYRFYAQARAQEKQQASALLQQRKHQRQRGEALLHEQQQQLQRRTARADRQAAHANQAPILLGLQKSSSQNSTGKLRLQQQARREALTTQVKEAAAQVLDDAPVLLLPPEAQTDAPQKIAMLESVLLPFVDGPRQKVELSLQRGERLSVEGPNGSGKSTLLKVLAGRLTPLQGQVQRAVPCAWLDQQLADLCPQRSTLEQLQALNPSSDQGTLRTRLALMGLDAVRALLPTALLSGGERLKAALACALHADPPAQLLLLDEPGNHLDLESLAALENMLRQYRGTLVVISHDASFLGNIGITMRLQAGADGWERNPV